uniref:Protein kinase domain-containing protein n=1 Tax=Neogobius melanostomus TaxID=47308 RepID=A0A8C6V2J9_9GOBI
SNDHQTLKIQYGEGRYGKVLKCLNNETGEIVAVKAIKICEKTDYVIAREVFMLDKVSALDPDLDNVIRFNKYFKSADGHHCMEFELLDLSVEDLMKKRRAPFSLNEIRPMAKDLLISLKGLRNVGVMHTDLKPDNVMCVDQQNKPFKVKLIDFGVATLTERAKVGKIMQPLGYRAPEVTLGLPLTEAVDMWSLGCCLLEWYLSWRLKEVSEYKAITDLLQKMFHVDPDKRITPAEALSHPFITMTSRTETSSTATQGIEETSENANEMSERSTRQPSEISSPGNSVRFIKESSEAVRSVKPSRVSITDTNSNNETSYYDSVEGFMSLLSDYECEVEDGNNPADMYDLLEFMGEGCYGKVMKCLNKETGEIVALKAIKMCEYADYFVARELYMMDKISALDPDADHIIRFNKYFKSADGHHCMEFELLDLSVDNLMKRRRAPFSLNEIRPMARTF